MECSQTITRKSASNLALAFGLLPKDKRDGMVALYAFCRQVDDVADDDSIPVATRASQLAMWRSEIRLACDGGTPSHPVVKELAGPVRTYGLPFELFDELILGVESDLDVTRYATCEDLELYCYRVASVVGLLSIEIMGYQDPRCREYAVFLGKALQLTNILRDVRNDAERGRIYIPLSELQRFGVEPRDILEFRYSDEFYNLTRSVAGRARGFYQSARESLADVDRGSMATSELMATVYWRLLRKLENRRFNVFDGPAVRLSKPQKLLLVLRAKLRGALGVFSSSYGGAESSA